MSKTIVEAPSASLPEGFCELTPKVYADEPMWVPEDPDSLRRAFSDANPWYAEGGESAAFCIPGYARLATFISPAMGTPDQKVVYFGYWETIGDREADDAIFERAAQWAKERGASAIYGPISFTTYGNYRTRVSATDGGYTFANEPFNPPYYVEILDRLGFHREVEALTQFGPGDLAAMVRKARMPKLEAVREAGFRIENLPHELWLGNMEQMHVIVDSIFRENWGYTPISLEQFSAACGEKFIRKTDPNTSTVAFDPDGNIVGFILVYPHWGPLICQSAGADRVPLDDIDYETHWPKLVETGHIMAVSKTTATIPSMQNRGIFNALSVSMFERGEGIFSHWYAAVLGAEKFNRRYADGLADDSRWYAVYGKSI